MIWEQVAFSLFTCGFMVLSIIKTIDTYKDKLKLEHKLKKEQESPIGSESDDYTNGEIKVIYDNEKKRNDLIKVYKNFKLHKLLPKHEEELKMQQTRFIKLILNYCSTFNSRYVLLLAFIYLK
jgi:hypothetical protein